VAHAREDFRRILFNLLPPTAPIAKLAAAQLVINEFQVNR
jgi:hypothetical protein